MNEVLQSLQIRECDLACELKGREKEVRLLTVAFKKSITTPGGPGHLHYVAGQPGTGKTLTVKYVLKRLTRDGLKFRMGEVNILRMASSTMIFRELYKLALPKKSLAGDYYTELGKYMKKKSAKKIPLVLVIDEFDNLNFRNRAFNEKLYEVFDWTHLPNAALTVICIANTIALPDTIVPRCSSRLGNGSIIFPAYTWQQLYDVVMERSGGKILSLFDETALQLVCRKCAARSGDARNCLQTISSVIIERRGTGSGEQVPTRTRRAISRKPNADTTGRISCADVNRVMQANSSNVMASFVAGFPTAVKILLCCIVLSIDKNTSTAQAHRTFNRFCSGSSTSRELQDAKFRQGLEILIGTRIIRFVLGVELKPACFVRTKGPNAQARQLFECAESCHLPWGQWQIILMSNVYDILDAIVKLDLEPWVSNVRQEYHSIIGDM